MPGETGEGQLVQLNPTARAGVDRSLANTAVKGGSNLKDEEGKDRVSQAGGVDRLASDPDPIKQIEEELVSNWEKVHGNRWEGKTLKAEFQDFIHGDSTALTRGEVPITLKERVRLEYLKRNPDKVQEMKEAERVKVYGDPYADPEIRRVGDLITTRTNLDPEVVKARDEKSSRWNEVWYRANNRIGMQGWNAFVDQNPQKAQAYQDQFPPIKAIFEGRERARKAKAGMFSGDVLTSVEAGRALKFINTPEQPSQADLAPKTLVSTAEVIKVLTRFPEHKSDYSIEDAKADKPLMHYSKAGNIFQVLRFGIQSNNFKNNVNALRSSNPEAARLAREMCGLRIKQGGSYQGKDSISLSLWNEKMFTAPGNVMFLINPNIKVFGTKVADREPTGYGHGIKTQIVDGYEVGNPTAYADEVVAGNVILPQEIKAIVVDPSASIVRDFSRTAQENAKLYMQEKNRNPYAAEDLTANIRLLADLVRDESLGKEADAFEKIAGKLPYHELSQQLIALQRKGLSKFVGEDQVLDEANLRNAIQKRFGVSIMVKGS